MAEERPTERERDPKQSSGIQDPAGSRGRMKRTTPAKCRMARAGGKDSLSARRTALRDVSNRSTTQVHAKPAAPKQELEAETQPLKEDKKATNGSSVPLLPPEPPPPTWHDLPEVLLRHIASFTDCKGAARLCATSRLLHRCLHDAVHIAPKLHLPSSPFYYGERLYVPVPPPASLSCMDVNAKHNGTTALQRAIQLKHWSMISALLRDPRIDPSLMLDATNARGVIISRSAERIFLPTPAHKACWEGRFDAALLHELQHAQGAAVDVYFKSHASPSVFIMAALGGCKAWLEGLLALKAAKKHHWGDAMVWAVRGGERATVEVLLDLHGKSGLLEEQKAEFEDLALFSAVEAGRRDMVRYLLSRVQRLKYSMACYTPEGFKYHMHAAAAQGYDHILEDLLNASCFHPDSYLNGGQRLLDSALFHGRLSTVRMLLYRGSKILQGKMSDSLARPIRTADVAMAELLLRNGADVNFTEVGGMSHAGETYLHMALQYHGPRRKVASMARLLLKYGVNVNGTSCRDGISVLHRAIAAKDPPLVRLLLAYGADATATDKVGHTPLHWAASTGHLACIKVLLAGLIVQHNWKHLKEVQLAINMAKKGMVYWGNNKSQAVAIVQLLKDYELSVRELIKASWQVSTPRIGGHSAAAAAARPLYKR